MDRMRLPQGYEENFDDISTSLDSRFDSETPEEALYEILNWNINGSRGGYPEESSNSDKVDWISRTPLAYHNDHEAATMTLEAMLQNAHLFDEEFPKHTVGENLVVDNGVFVNSGAMKTADVVYENSDGELDLGINLPELGLTSMWIDEPAETDYAIVERAAVFGYQFRDATSAYMNAIGVEPGDNVTGVARDLGETTTPASMNDDLIAVPDVSLYESDTAGYRDNPEQVISNVMAIRDAVEGLDAEYAVLGRSEGEVEVVETGKEAVYDQVPESIGITD